MLVKVLGSGAGGGFPQWNCNTALSRLGWDRDARAVARTQSSIAVSAGGESWIVINASPDIRQQIAVTKELQPKRDGPARNSPIQAVVLTNGDVDHIAGLLSLRERQTFAVYATPRVLSILKQNSIFDVLAAGVVQRIPLSFDVPIAAPGTNGVTVEAFPVPGKVPLYLEDERAGTGLASDIGDTIGLKIHAGGSAALFYIPGCALICDALLGRLQGAGCLLFDGTVFTDGEMIGLGVGEKTGRRMGHVPISGEGGSLHGFERCPISRKAYIHINTTNPILESGSEPERLVRAAGWEIAYDGMTVKL